MRAGKHRGFSRFEHQTDEDIAWTTLLRRYYALKGMRIWCCKEWFQSATAAKNHIQNTHEQHSKPGTYFAPGIIFSDRTVDFKVAK
jgi:hypothetical protein